MKQALAGVLAGFQGLGSDSARERPVDRLAALAATQIQRGERAERSALLCSLGKSLIAFKFSNIARAKAECVEGLTAILAWPSWGVRIKRHDRELVANQAVIEWCLDMCPTCLGAGQRPVHSDLEGNQPMVQCSPCAGTGKRRWTERERIEGLGKRMDREMDTAWRIMAWAESLAVRHTREMLERVLTR